MKTIDPLTSTIRATNPTSTSVTVNDLTFEPGQSRYVTFLWMRNHYGDPRSKQSMPSIVKIPGSDQSIAVQPRETELARVRTVWNVYAGGNSWEDIPALEFYLDDERIYTVYDDPTGTTTSPHTESEATFAAQQDRISKLEQTIDAILKATGVSRENLPFDLADPTANADDLDIPTDDSTASRTTSPFAHAEPVDALLMDENGEAQAL